MNTWIKVRLLTNFQIKKILKKEDFLIYYSGLSTVDLLKIIEEKEKYQPDAIEAANKILSERNYSNDELNAAQAEINLLLNKKIERSEKINKKINGVNEFIDEHFGLRERSPEKILNLFCAGLFLYTFFSAIFNIKFLASIFYYKSPKGYFVAILIYTIQFLCIYLLYKRSNWGWVLIVGMHTVLVAQNIDSFIFLFRYRGEFLFFKPESPYTLLFNLCFNIGVIIFLNTKKIREQFSITRDNRIITLIASGVISLLYIFLM